MKLTIEIEVPDDIEPCTYVCMDHCPLSYYDPDENTSDCKHIFDEEGNWKCPVSVAMKQKKEN